MDRCTPCSSSFILRQQWVNGTVSLDTMQGIGFYDLRWRLALLTWQKLLQGRAKVNLQSTDAVVTEAVLLEILDDGQLGGITHAYNGTLSLNQEARTLFVRSVIVAMTDYLGCSSLIIFQIKQGCLEFIMQKWL